MYSAQSRAALKVVWKDTGYIGAARLKAALPEWLPFFDSPICDDATRAQLLKMSSATIERILNADKATLRRKLNTGTRRGPSAQQTAALCLPRQLGGASLGACDRGRFRFRLVSLIVIILETCRYIGVPY